VNKTELIEYVASSANLSKKAASDAVAAFVDGITKTLKKGGRVQLTGFGTFVVRQRSARTGRNPRTGEVIKIKASKAPAFVAGKGLKDSVK